MTTAADPIDVLVAKVRELLGHDIPWVKGDDGFIGCPLCNMAHHPSDSLTAREIHEPWCMYRAVEDVRAALAEHERQCGAAPSVWMVVRTYRYEDEHGGVTLSVFDTEDAADVEADKLRVEDCGKPYSYDVTEIEVSRATPEGPR